MIGKTLAHYEITAHLGTGGMGEVYRATDAKLGRDVAIKVLPETMAGDPERVARFQREARTLASLHHSHVASIFGFEEVDGVRFLVMELVEGHDLAARLQQGAMGVDEAVALASQIADGLEHAHEKGIVHRDLKPANVQLTPEGQAKILDFGLARAFLDEPEAEDPQTSPTITAAMTQAGVILGTASYMSPEQAKGKTVDKRADIWSFGVILFEMLTGERLFKGETVSETLAAVLLTEVDWSRLPAGTPPGLERLLRRCLERDPKLRLRDIGEARIALSQPLGSAEPKTKVTPARTTRRGLAIMGVLLLVSVVANALLALRGDEPALTDVAGETLHLAISLPPEAPLARARVHPLGVGRVTMSLSPDGKALVYVAEVEGDTRLYLRRLDAAQATELPGTRGGFLPRFSPQGNWIAFCTNERVKKIALSGGEPITLCEATNTLGMVWETQSSILACVNETSNIIRIDADSGRWENALDVPDHAWPVNFAMMPGTQQILSNYDVNRSLNPESSDVALLSLEDGAATVIARGGVNAQFVPTGHLIYMRNGTLMATLFDPATATTSGRPVPVLTNVRIGRLATPSFAFAANGTMAYVAGQSDLRGDLVWMGRDGQLTELGADPQIFGDFQISPDGQQVAATVGGDRNEIWIYEFDSGTRRKLSTERNGVSPVWSPDGSRIVFYSYGEDGGGAYIRPADGSSPAERLEVDGVTGRPYAWSADGEIGVSAGGNVVFLNPARGTTRSIGSESASDWGPHVSPDGQFVAYTSDESGRYEIYVREMERLERAWTLSVDGGEEPVWSRDGSKLFFRNGDAWLESDVRTDPEFRASRPRVIVEGAFVNVPGRSYDVSLDGERLLLIRNRGADEVSRNIEVVLNWFDELERLVPTD